MERLPKIRLEQVSKEKYLELIRRPDSRSLLNSLVFARAIIEWGLNVREIYSDEATDDKDSLFGCLMVLPVSSSREELAQKLEKRFSWISDFSDLRRDDYEGIVDMCTDMWSFLGDMDEWDREE